MRKLFINKWKFISADKVMLNYVFLARRKVVKIIIKL
ncbi:uncharacterized protein METZ01_LOCUS263322, partial [marine metagenome]